MSQVVKKKKLSDGITASASATVLTCKDCHLVKNSLWHCAWDETHSVCQDCAVACSRCGKNYCDDCRIVLVFCDTCDCMFCPTCKPRVCVCIVPRMATCFMINFKSKNQRMISDTTAKTDEESSSGRQTSDATNLNADPYYDEDAKKARI